MRIIALINQKGGVGKTTSCINICAALSLRGYDCLLVDVDPQGSLSVSAGCGELEDDDTTTYEILSGVNANKAVHDCGAYDIIPTDIRLSAGEIEYLNVDRRNYLLKEALAQLNVKYDFILIDCPPSLNIFTLMALTAATEIIIPVQAQYLPLVGVSQMIETINVVKERFNPELEIDGVLLTIYNDRRSLDTDVQEALENYFKDKVFKTKITQSTKSAEAPSHGKDIIAYSPKSKNATQYKQLAEELINMKPQEKGR